MAACVTLAGYNGVSYSYVDCSSMLSCLCAIQAHCMVAGILPPSPGLLPENEFKKEQDAFEIANHGNFEKIYPLPTKNAAESN